MLKKLREIQNSPPNFVDGMKTFNELHVIRRRFLNAQIITIKVMYQMMKNLKLSAALNNEEYSFHSNENMQNRPVEIMAETVYNESRTKKS